MGPSGVRRGRQAAGSHDSGETEKQWRPLQLQLVGTGAAVDTKDLQHSQCSPVDVYANLISSSI